MPNFSDKKILLIEDEQFLAEMYEMKFKKEGFNMITAGDGREGIEMARSEKPDLIFLDLVMPNIDGYQVLGTLKGDPKTKGLKIYILSNLAQEEEIEKGMKAGANGYLQKASLTPTQLLDLTKRIMNGEDCGLRKITKKEDKKTNRSNLKNNNGKNNQNGKQVLIIEDEEDIVEMYKFQLEQDGFKVDIAKNGAWGLKLAKQKKFDIIILDMMMPAMDGYTALTKMKKIDSIKNVPIMVLSNSAQDQDIAKAKKCGATCYLLKSRITPKRLTAEVKKMLK